MNGSVWISLSQPIRALTPGQVTTHTPVAEYSVIAHGDAVTPLTIKKYKKTYIHFLCFIGANYLSFSLCVWLSSPVCCALQRGRVSGQWEDHPAGAQWIHTPAGPWKVDGSGAAKGGADPWTAQLRRPHSSRCGLSDTSGRATLFMKTGLKCPPGGQTQVAVNSWLCCLTLNFDISAVLKTQEQNSWFRCLYLLTAQIYLSHSRCFFFKLGLK